MFVIFFTFFAGLEKKKARTASMSKSRRQTWNTQGCGVPGVRLGVGVWSASKRVGGGRGRRLKSTSRRRRRPNVAGIVITRNRLSHRFCAPSKLKPSRPQKTLERQSAIATDPPKCSTKRSGCLIARSSSLLDNASTCTKNGAEFPPFLPLAPSRYDRRSLRDEGNLPSSPPPDFVPLAPPHSPPHPRLPTPTSSVSSTIVPPPLVLKEPDEEIVG